MARKELHELTVEELKKRAGVMKVTTWFLAVVLIISFCVSLYYTVRDEKMQTSLVVPIALLPVVLINFGIIKKINTEIKPRVTDQSE